MRRYRRIAVLAFLPLFVWVAAACSSSGPRTHALTPLQKWMAHTPMYIAHRGGDADWPEGTAYAYARAAAWNSNLALEVPVWRTPDGVWVVSEDATTSRVFGQNYTIRDTPWATLAGLRGLHGGQPMARLVNDVLDVYGRSRILFIDDKSDTNVAELLDLLDSFAGPSRYVVKSFCRSTNAPKLARARGYLTWGYYFANDMSIFESTQSRFDMVGLNYMAPSANFMTMHDTGKPVVAHIISTTDAARTALANGVQGLMVSAVEQVVPPQSH